MKAQTANKPVKNFYDRCGEGYSRAWASLSKKYIDRFETKLIRKAVEKATKSKGDKRIKVLDVGIGTGRIASVLLKDNVKYYGVDISEKMIKICKKRFKGNKKIKALTVWDIASSFPNEFGRFDLITAVRSLYYTNAWRKTISQARARLNPGGIFFFTFPNRYSTSLLPRLLFKKRGVKSYQTKYSELEDVIKKAGFSDYEIRGYAKLPDTLYDFCNGNYSTTILILFENILRFSLGETFLARMFYVTCKK